MPQISQIKWIILCFKNNHEFTNYYANRLKKFVNSGLKNPFNLWQKLLKTESIFYEKYQTPSLYSVILFSVV